MPVLANHTCIADSGSNADFSRYSVAFLPLQSQIADSDGRNGGKSPEGRTINMKTNKSSIPQGTHQIQDGLVVLLDVFHTQQSAGVESLPQIWASSFQLSTRS